MKKYFVLSLVAVALTGCGTVFTGTTKTVNMNMSGQNMNNKTLLVNGRQYPMTNGYANVKLNKSCNDVPVYLKDDKSGKLDVLPSIESSFQPACVLNLFNILFWGIDLATGAVCTYDGDYSAAIN